jgi:rhodanese-related sulfurtransferase
MRRELLLILTWTLSVFSACSQNSFEKKLEGMYKKTVPLIRPEQLSDWTSSGEKLILLDTRSQREYEISHLPNARFIDYDSFTGDKVSDLSPSSKVIVYCSVGYRSERIGEELQKLGFENVYNLYGGIFQWKNNDYKIVNQLGMATDSVHAYNRLWGKWLEKGIKVYD